MKRNDAFIFTKAPDYVLDGIAGSFEPDPDALPVAGPQPMNGQAERRGCERFAVKSGAFAILRPASAPPPRIQDMGMGDIAFAMYRLRPLRMGPIRDVGVNGLSFSYVESGASFSEPLALDILSAETGFYLRDLAFRIMWDRGLADDIDVDYVPLRQAGLWLQAPLAHQRRKLEDFVRNHTRN